MNSAINSDKKAAIDLSAAAHAQPGMRIRTSTLLTKALIIIFVCDAALIVLLGRLPDIWKGRDLIFCSILLSAVNAGILYWIIRPINQILRTKEKSERNLDLFRSLIDKSNDLVFIVEPESAKILYANYGACMMLGYGRPELLNLTISDISEHFLAGSWKEYIGKVRNNGYVIIDKARRKDGSVFPVEVNASIVNVDGRDYIVAMVRDVTEREQARIRLEESETIKKMAECARDAILMMGPKGEISFWNPAAERIFGYSRNEAIGKHLHELLAPKRFRDAYQKGLLHFHKTGQGNAIGKTLKLSAVRKNGEEFDVELSVNAVYLGNKWHSVGIVRDMSESNRPGADLENKNHAAVTASE
jgi:PAS domain S-box-containing protein